jgi:hypothetical protein
MADTGEAPSNRDQSYAVRGCSRYLKYCAADALPLRLEPVGLAFAQPTAAFRAQFEAPSPKACRACGEGE